MTLRLGACSRTGVVFARNFNRPDFMMFASGAISGFVGRHPTVKMLALSFLLMISLVLIAEGFGRHIPKGYVYFTMGFSVFVEMLNLRIRKGGRPVDLHQSL